MRTHDAFDYLTIKQLDPKNETDKEFIEEFWLNV
jgi:hypothetical protein